MLVLLRVRYLKSFTLSTGVISNDFTQVPYVMFISSFLFIRSEMGPTYVEAFLSLYFLPPQLKLPTEQCNLQSRGHASEGLDNIHFLLVLVGHL